MHWESPSSLPHSTEFTSCHCFAKLDCPIRFHDLRHTAVSLLLLQGVRVKVVSEMLGHASVPITLDRYSQVLPDMQHDAMQSMQKVLGS